MELQCMRHMSRGSHNDSSTSTAGVTFQGDLTRSGPSFNGHAFFAVCFLWPRAPGGVERFHAYRTPRGQNLLVEFL